MRQTIGILGIPIDNLDTEATLDRLDQFIQERRFHQVATANVDFLINAMHDRELRQILRDADLVTPDGMPVVWASRLLGSPLPERVTGADLVPRLAALAARKGYRVYMLGARPEVAQQARDRMIEANPSLQIVGCVSPQISPLLAMDSEALLHDIVSAKPDILLVAFGNPKQEKWIHLHRDRLRHVPVCIGIGGTFDFLAGRTSRAPWWMQRLGMEWLYRLAQEPKRLWRRYCNDFIYFVRFLARQWWAARAQGRGREGVLCADQVGEYTVVKVSGALGARQRSELQRLAQDALERSPHLILDLQRCNAIDAATLGTLVNLTKRARHIGREVRVASAQPALQMLIRTTYADECLALYATVEEAQSAMNVGSMQINMFSANTATICTLKGTADFDQALALQIRLDALPPAVRQIDLDLREVTYIDCGMLAMLRRFSRMAETAGRCVRLSVSPIVHAMLTQEKILNDFVLYDGLGAPTVLADLSTPALANQRQA